MKKLGTLLLSAVLLISALPGGAAASNIEHSENGYIVKLREPTKSGARLLDKMDLQEISADAGFYKAETAEEIQKLGSMVEYYEPDCKAKLFAVPNDPYLKQQWNINSIGISSAWDKGYEGTNVKVAVIDSGVNSLHEDFSGTHFDKGSNMLDGSHDISDQTGHGTLVSGIIGATRNNAVGIAGLCGGITIVPIKCFGDSVETDASYIISGLYEAVDIYKCDVVNLSLGVPHQMESMAAAIKNAVDKGVIIVSAVGNDGTSAMQYPAAYDTVVGVGAVDSFDKVASFSQKNKSVFLTAPGVKVYGPDHKTKNRYKEGDGTSYSAPHVAAAAAILKQYAPTADVDDFMALLKSSAVDLGTPGYDSSYGYGRLSMSNFVSAMEAYSFSTVGDTFPDVKGHWAEQYIEYCVANKIFSGVTKNSFEPETTMSRAMFVTVLSRLSGERIGGFANTFSDVPDDAWYAQPCAWGAAAGIVQGTGDGKFSPDKPISREQLAAYLFRYATVYGISDGTVNREVCKNFKDYSKASYWAKDALAWCVEKGFLSGRTDTRLCPGDSAKRCEAAAIMYRVANTIK
ncbi:MAG: S8 family serine peptidase [Oscillospiraceae bacterium]